MAYGYEIVLQLTTDEVRELVAPADRHRSGQDLLDSVDLDIQRALATAHRMMLTSRLGDVALDRTSFAGGLWVSTPTWRRRFTPASLAAFGSEGELDRILGVALTSRYAPRWLDWQHEHGGSGEDIDVDTPQARQMIREARKAFAAVVPALEQAPLTVVAQFY